MSAYEWIVLDILFRGLSDANYVDDDAGERLMRVEILEKEYGRREEQWIIRSEFLVGDLADMYAR